MKHIINQFIGAVACTMMAATMVSCDTDVESVDINQPGIDAQNPELYAKYLAQLRAYKQTEHSVAFGWFDNSEKMPYSQGQHIHSVPDSLDYVVLTAAGDLTDWELKEMAEIRAQKGTKVVYDISFEEIYQTWLSDKQIFEETNEDPEKTFTDFNTYLVDNVSVRLAYCEKFGYDGVVMAYNGKDKYYLDEIDKMEIIGWENDFIGMAKDWAERHTGKELILMGKPQNVEDQTVFGLANYIIIPCQSEGSASGLTYTFIKAAADGVPVEKMLPLVTMTSKDTTDKNTGYWSDGSMAVLSAARWASADHDGLKVAGLGIEMMNNDYYHPTFTYPNVRTAISIINPTVKN